jgi:hypothetical protein
MVIRRVVGQAVVAHAAHDQVAGGEEGSGVRGGAVGVGGKPTSTKFAAEVVSAFVEQAQVLLKQVSLARTEG